jgi:GntR family transcriptional regulator/MocR family aminotransferase
MLLNLRGTGGPLYRRVYHAVKHVIRAGRLGPAARLPSTRALARDLRVSRNTVMLAYEQLSAEGYLVSRHRSVTSVAGAVPLPLLPAPSGQKRERPPRISAYGAVSPGIPPYRRRARTPADPGYATTSATGARP